MSCPLSSNILSPPIFLFFTVSLWCSLRFLRYYAEERSRKGNTQILPVWKYVKSMRSYIHIQITNDKVELSHIYLQYCVHIIYSSCWRYFIIIQFLFVFCFITTQTPMLLLKHSLTHMHRNLTCPKFSYGMILLENMAYYYARVDIFAWYRKVVAQWKRDEREWEERIWYARPSTSKA